MSINKLLPDTNFEFISHLEPAQQEKVISEVITQIFADYALFKQQGEGSLSGLAMNSVWTVSDVAYLYRLIHDLMLTIDHVHPDTINAGITHALTASATNLGYQACGSASGLNFIIGIAQVKEAIKHHQFSEAIGDQRGTLMDRVAVLKGTTLCLGGGLFGIYRIIEMVRCFGASPKGLAQASSMMSLVGTVFYAAYFALISVIFGIRIYEGAKLRHKINKADSEVAALKILQNKLVVDRVKIEKKLTEKMGGAEAKEYLLQEGYAIGIRHMQALRKELNLPVLSEEKMIEKIKGELEKQGKDPAAFIEQLGFNLHCDNVSAKKEAKLNRALGKSGVEAIKKIAENLSEDESKEILETVKGASTKELTVQAAVLAVSLLGIGVMIGSIVFTGGGALLPMAIIALVFGVAMFGVDGYYLLQSYREEAPAPHDKKMLAISTAVGVMAFLMVVAVMASGSMTMGIFPLVVALVLLGLWVGQNGLTWAVILRKERLYQKQGNDEEDLRRKALLRTLFKEALKKKGELCHQ